MNDYEAKQEARKQRLLDLADRMQSASDAAYKRASDMASVIPMGQPILVGHHSEKRDRSYRARIWRTQDRCLELQRKAEYFRGKAASVGHGGISSDNPDAADQLRAKLLKLEKMQAAMVAANKIYRSKLSDDEKVSAVVVLGVSEATARGGLKPDFCGRIGFPDYAIKNNSANMRRIRERIEALCDKPTETVEREIAGVTVREDADENRLMLVFPGKPVDAIRAMLKQNGFRWSPTSGAWQRQLNNSARAAANYVLQKLQGGGHV